MRTCTLAQFTMTGQWPAESFVLKHRSFDIPATIHRFILALPANCVAVGLGDFGGHAMRRQAERAARRRGIRILWRGYAPAYPSTPAKD